MSTLISDIAVRGVCFSLTVKAMRGVTVVVDRVILPRERECEPTAAAVALKRTHVSEITLETRRHPYIDI